MTFKQWLSKTFGPQVEDARACRLGEALRAARQRHVPRVEFLEGRLAPAVLFVNSLADNATPGDSLVTLREAINAANNDTSTDLGQTASDADLIVSMCRPANGSST